MYSSDEELQENSPPQAALKDSQSVGKRRPQQTSNSNVFHFQTFDKTVICSSDDETAFESTRVDWFGMLDGLYTGKNIGLKYFHYPKELKTSPLDLTIARGKDKLYLPVDINEHINEMLSYIMADYHKPSIFTKMW